MSLSTFLDPALILGGVGVTFGTLISAARHRFAVWEDPRIEGATELLPGTNCGACGFAGCHPFADGLVEGKAEPAQCTQMSAEAIDDLALYLGVEAGVATKRVARLLCAGGSDVAVQRADYRGLPTCAAAAAVAGGGKGCTWGCLGLTDCEVACDYDAIHMTPLGLPVVTPELCTACGDCVDACPKDLFTVMPTEQMLLVQCVSRLAGDEAEELCAVACTACARCVQDAAPGVVEMVDELAVVDYSRNDAAGPEAVRRCPTNAIVWVEGMQSFGERTELAGSVVQS